MRSGVSMDIEEVIKIVPTTRYQGSKRKILPWIYDCIKDIEFDTVLDAFGGSGMVSYLFKSMGKRVTYNDLFRFNGAIGKSIIENETVRLSDSDVTFLLNSSMLKEGFIQNTFHDIYFLDEENLWLDNVVKNIENLATFYSGSTLAYKQAIAYNALFQSCMAKRPYNLFHRKNLYMRTKDVPRSFGNKTTWDRPFHDHFCSFVKEINRAVFCSGISCRAICQDALSLGENQYDLVYLDPPYIKKGGDYHEGTDYLKYYHFLEGLINYHQWGNLIDSNSVNKRIRKEYLTNEFVPSKSQETFGHLIKQFRNSVLVLSYRYGGTPTIDELSQIILKYKSNIKVYDKHYCYALNKQNGNAVLNREYLIIGY